MTENTNINETVEAWADILIEKWEMKMYALKINNTYSLLESFKHEVFNNAGGDAFKITFAFNYYGKFVDMGVGNGIPLGVISENRKPKPWYSKTFFSELLKLQEILAEKYARKGTLMVVEAINGNNNTHLI